MTSAIGTSMRVIHRTRMFWRFMPVILALLVAGNLAGCASGSLSNVFSSTPKQKALSPVAFAPIIGAPPKVSQELTSQLAAQAQQHSIPVSDRTESAEYTVRGYLAASQDQKHNKLAYIWDVTDKSGKRVHRILGEEVTPAKPGRDVWSSFDQDALQKVAAKTASDLATWLPTQGPGASPQPTAALQEQEREPPARKERERKVAAKEERAPEQPAQPSPPAERRAAVPREEVMTYVPAVEGAPGDGHKSLTIAVKKELFKKGLKLASTAGDNTYTVRGKVHLGKPADGQQDIKIEWQVLNPGGQRLGTVSQANKIPAGSLDGQWGPIADAAATAAVDGIAKLIPKQ